MAYIPSSVLRLHAAILHFLLFFLLLLLSWACDSNNGLLIWGFPVQKGEKM